MASPRPKIRPELIADSDETRAKMYEEDLPRYQRCSLTPSWVDCADISHILDLTPGRDVYIQQEMVGRYIFCCNQEDGDTQTVLIEQSWVNTRLGEHIVWKSGQHHMYCNDPFESAIPDHFESELRDF